MKIAVTGATGFTGRRVVGELLARGHGVAALVRRPLTGPDLGPKVEPREGDLGRPATLLPLLEGCEALVHVAAFTPGQWAGLLEALDRSSVRRAVFFSSTRVLSGVPAPDIGPRREAEEWVRHSRTEWTILRPTMIYGDEGDRNMSRLIRFLCRSPVVPLPGGGRALVQPVHVEDVARGAVDALECGRARRRVYDLPGREASPLRDVVLHVARLVGRRPWLVQLPLAPAAAAARLWWAVGLPPRLSPEQIWRLGEDKAFPCEEARADWGYAPRGWREGLEAEVVALRRSGLVT